MTATPRPKLPKLRRQKEKGRPDRAFVVLDGRKVPCGRWGTDDAQRRYDRAVSEWLANHRRLPVQADQVVTVAVLVDRFTAHAQQHYVHPDGTPTSKQAEYRQVVKPALALYADLPAEDFTPRCLRAVRQRMIEAGWSCSTINSRVRLLRHVFKWASGHELVASEVHRRLADVEPLQPHRSEAPDTEPVGPVDESVVEATMEHLTPTLRAMVRVQALTGMRPAEVCSMTTGAIDTSGDEVWTYTVTGHKTAHRGRKRVVFIGPQAQDELRPYLKTDLAAPVFSPRQSERERYEAMREQRTTPDSCGNHPGDNRVDKPRRSPAERWTTQSFGRAIVNACDDAFPPPEHLARQRVEGDGRKGERWETRAEWRSRLKRARLLDELDKWQKAHRWAPNQLRHAYASRVRREHGLEAAQVLLGHAKADVTQIYAERDVQKAVSVAQQVG